MFRVGRDLWGSSSPTSLPKQGHLQQAAQDLVQAGLEYLQRGRRHNLPGQPLPVLRNPQSEEVLPHVQTEESAANIFCFSKMLLLTHIWRLKRGFFTKTFKNYCWWVEEEFLWPNCKPLLTFDGMTYHPLPSLLLFGSSRNYSNTQIQIFNLFSSFLVCILWTGSQLHPSTGK